MRLMSPSKVVLQRRQPPGVPPLQMTGERTLPDVPQERYWYQRHVVVYEWIARRVAGKRVADLACGEGYGADILAATAEHVVGVDANPETFEHARLKYRRPNLRFVRELVEEFSEPVDVAAFLQTIEHVPDPDLLLSHLKDLVSRKEAEAIISTPNVLMLAAQGEEKSGNPWHITEYDPEGFFELLQRHFAQIELFGVYHTGRLALWDRLADTLGFDRQAVHRSGEWPRLPRSAFLRWVRPADFRLRGASTAAELGKAEDLLAVVRA
jgi:SAM-dependent methyltransferase